MTTDSRTAYPQPRRFTRVAFDAPAWLVAPDGGTFQSALMDISLKGALLALPSEAQVAVGEAYRLEVPLASGEVVIAMDVTAAHVQAQSAGFRCERIDVDSIVHLRRLLELNLGDAELIKRELGALGNR